MKQDESALISRQRFSRRLFVKGLAAGGVLSAMPRLLYANTNDTRLGSAPVLSGQEINLIIAETPVNFTGVMRMATTVNGSIPAPTLRLREGEEVTIRVTNRLSVSTSIHWHGIILPYEMDGVPGISFRGIAPQETFEYRFTLQQSGTYWYHSHSGFQEMTGMYGAIIVEPREGESFRAEQDHVIQLSDWSDEDPMSAFSKLKVQSDVYNFNQPVVGEFLQDASTLGTSGALNKRKMWNQMRMNPTDLADLSATTFTYLMNGMTPAGNWNGLFNKGERVRLRFINGSSNSFYDVRIPGLSMTVVQADGQNVKPVRVDEFRFGPGETYDVLVDPQDDAYTIFAQSMDRSGYASGTLSVRPGMVAAVPELDPVEWLAMTDMMGAMDHSAMKGMDHSTMKGMKGMKGMNDSAMKPAIDHSAMKGMNDSAMKPAIDHSAMKGMNDSAMKPAIDHSAMKGMNDSAMKPAIDHSAMKGMNDSAMKPAMDRSAMKGMDHSAMGHSMETNPLATPSQTVRHASTEYGPSVDMRVDTPRTNLDDPGIGLRNNGRRVLTLADLRSVTGVLDDDRVPTREIELHLTGNMERYSWSIDGLEFGQSTPVSLLHGERVRVILQNDTMMTHPMHLHGMWSDLESAEGDLLVRRHTISVQPAQRVSFLTTPHEFGRWAWHCHLLFHMDAGMFREVVVS
ncbi:copper resistance system multicopper oxidase [Neptunomonas antarctica]|uniref:copper resistance system multicopper oxidase n=1 Tax=Neptunomonas antarctica TaxID=619304 RepID=UPI0006C7A8D6|nr:copper resistance system multicopper oxidase [Neptunomonas antarctica]